MSKQPTTMPVGKPQQNLQSIPPELRIMIFELVLLHAGSINLSGLPYNADSAPGRHAVESFRGLSVQCRQMHHEVESIFFARNTFCLQANGLLPSIPTRYLETMRNIELIRVMVGKTFVLKICRSQDGGVKTSTEVVARTKDSGKGAMQTPSQVENIIISRLTQGAEIAARMIRRSLENGEGMRMAAMQAVATQMNRQWVIAI